MQLFGFFNVAFAALFSTLTSNSQQNVPILNYSVDQNQRVQVEIQADEDNYYFLKTKHDARAVSSHFVKMELGKNGKLILSESLKAYPKEQYEVVSFPKNNPSDVDKDGVDDLTEFADKVNASPLNAAKPISFT
ncbi:MAG: hypothetical protein NWQ46_06240, partial [Spirosomaceae bacterium]|nr:hypothetical protein [Spirosomataceae bacterium]